MRVVVGLFAIRFPEGGGEILIRMNPMDVLISQAVRSLQ